MALHIVAFQNQIFVAKLLLQAEAGTNGKKYNGNTSLYLATEFKSPEVTRLLVGRGADI